MMNSSSFHSVRRDPVRRGSRLRIRVDVRPEKTTLPGVEPRVPHGVQEVEIHSLDLDKCKELVCGEPDEAKLREATDIYDRKLRAHIRDQLHIELPDDREDWPEQARQLEYMFTATSPMAEFYDMMGRGMKPLRSLEVLETLPPEEDERLLIAKDVAVALNDNAETKVLREQVALLTAKIDAMESGASKAAKPASRRK